MDSKVIVVTGGASGIGRATVLRFSEEGYRPVILDRDAEAGAATLALLEAKPVEGQFIQADLTQKGEVTATFEKILAACGRIDVLVNLAGGTFHKGAIHEVTPAQWKECLDLNLKTTFLCSQAVIAPMKQAGQGTIVNTASNFGITGGAERTHYAASKAAIIAFSKSLATELAPHGIRVNTIAPGLTGTQAGAGQVRRGRVGRAVRHAPHGTGRHARGDRRRHLLPRRRRERVRHRRHACTSTAAWSCREQASRKIDSALPARREIALTDDEVCWSTA